MADSTTTTLNNLVGTYFYKVGLERLQAQSMLYGFAVKTPLPKGEGTTVRWNGWSNFAPVSVTLASEVAGNTAASISARKVEATIAQYGRHTTISNLAEYSTVLDAMQGAMDVLADSAVRSVETVLQLGVFKSTIGTNADGTILSGWMSCLASGFHAGSNGSSSALAWGFPVVFGTSATQLSAVGATAPSASACMGGWVLKKAAKQLRRKNAIPFADGNFVCLMNTDACSDLTRDEQMKAWFANVDNSPSVDNVVQAKPFVRAFGVTVYPSNMMPRYRVTAHSCDVSFMFGKGALGCTEFGTNGKSGFELIVKRPGNQDTSQPYNMYSTVAYKITMAAKAINTSAGRILITHSKP